jgi:hypothetical protein
MTKPELESILDQLITLGEDADELNYWRDVFEDLPADKQEEVCLLFKAELQELTEANASETQTTAPPSNDHVDDSAQLSKTV